MHVKIDSEAIRWIETKGNQLTVKTLDVKSCCAPGLQEVVAVPGKPKSLSTFNELIYDNLSLYVHKNISKKNNLNLRLSGFGFLKSISAKLE
ncbi:MAG: Fe-S oxidoreductase [Neobacillus sp.]|jgi:hypothetical protein|nr:Fe-S oxidoreductase [Neobacillus sp.]